MENNDDLVIAARELVKKLLSLPADDRYMAPWICYANHGGKYDGPFYVDELEALKDELVNRGIEL
jgi:hypothetical protein